MTAGERDGLIVACLRSVGGNVSATHLREYLGRAKYGALVLTEVEFDRALARLVKTGTVATAQYFALTADGQETA